MPEPIISAIDRLRAGNRVVTLGIIAIVGILAATAVFLFLSLPDGNAFNARVEDIFAQNNALTSSSDVQLLEILAQSGTAFSDVLASYRMVIFVLLVFSTALLIAALVFLVTIITQNRRISAIQATGIQVSSLLIIRAENTVYLNNLEFKLTEARMDDEVLSGAELEAVISGKSSADCEEAAGATRIKRLRDTLGNQIVSELLVKNIARRGYMLAIDKDVIRMV